MKKQQLKLLIALGGLCVLTWASCTKDKNTEVGPKEAPIRPVVSTSNAYVTTLFDFNPAPGQFVNTGISDTAAAKATLKTDQGW